MASPIARDAMDRPDRIGLGKIHGAEFAIADCYRLFS